MSARTAAATVEESLPVESTIEAEIKSLIEEQTPKRIQVVEQIPKRIQIENDAERSRSFVALCASESNRGGRNQDYNRDRQPAFEWES
jgi:hypothetical protein